MTAKATLFDIILWHALAAMWSSSYAAIKLGVAETDPTVLVAGRLWLGAAVIYAVLRLKRMRLSRKRADWLCYAVSGLLGSAVPFLLITWGEQSVDSALACIFMGIAPVATVVMASAVFPDERLTPRIGIGLCCGCIGIVVLVGPGALRGIGTDVLAQAAILTAALCYALTTIYVRRFVQRPPLEMAAGSMIVGAASLTCLGAVTGVRLENFGPSAASIGAVVYLGLFSTALATLIYFHLVPRLGATRMSQINFAVPVGGAMIGTVALAETLTPDRIIALAVIMMAIFLVTSKPRRAYQPSSRQPAPRPCASPSAGDPDQTPRPGQSGRARV